jgi:hypothetical protein
MKHWNNVGSFPIGRIWRRSVGRRRGSTGPGSPRLYNGTRWAFALVGPGWAGLGLAGPGRAGPGWAGLGWAGLGWAGLSGLGWGWIGRCKARQGGGGGGGPDRVKPCRAVTDH